MGLELYEQFNNRYSGRSYGDESDALGAHLPMILDNRLRDLKRIADEGNIDGWMDHIDPHLSYYENKSRLQEVAGLTGYSTPIKSDREDYVKRMMREQEDREVEMMAELVDGDANERHLI